MSKSSQSGHHTHKGPILENDCRVLFSDNMCAVYENFSTNNNTKSCFIVLPSTYFVFMDVNLNITG